MTLCRQKTPTSAVKLHLVGTADEFKPVLQYFAVQHRYDGLRVRVHCAEHASIKLTIWGAWRPPTAPKTVCSAYVTAFNRTSARSASSMPPGSARSDALSSTASLGCSRTNAWIDGRIGSDGSSSPCSLQPPSSSTQTASVRSENRP